MKEKQLNMQEFIQHIVICLVDESISGMRDEINDLGY